jgi:hypothetical protein
MGFLKKLFCWKRRRNGVLTIRDIAATRDNITTEIGTQISSIDVVRKCDAGTQTDFKLFHDASTETTDVGVPEIEEMQNTSTQTTSVNKQSEIEKEELQKKIAALEKFLEEKDRHIQELHSKTHEMNEEHRREIQFNKMKREMDKSSLLRKIWAMRTEIKMLKEQSGKDTEDHWDNNESDLTDSGDIGRRTIAFAPATSPVQVRNGIIWPIIIIIIISISIFMCFTYRIFGT